MPKLSSFSLRAPFEAAVARAIGAQASPVPGFSVLRMPSYLKPHLEPKHDVQRVRSATPFISSYLSQRDAHPTAGYESHPNPNPRSPEVHFDKTLTIFYPGFKSFKASRRYLESWADRSQHGAVFVGLSDDNIALSNGKYRIIGGHGPSHHPDWPVKLPTFLSRTHVALEMMPDHAQPEHFNVLGHSEGGLIARDMALVFELANQERWDEIKGLYPELAPDRFDRFILKQLAQRFNRAAPESRTRFIAIGTPFHGIDPAALAFARKSGFSWMFGGAQEAFSKEYLDARRAMVENVLGDPAGTAYQPHRLIDDFIYSVITPDNHVRRSPLFLHPFLVFADQAFGMSGKYLHSGPGDGLVGLPDVPENQLLTLLGFNHLGIVEHEAAADESIRFVWQRRNDADLNTLETDDIEPITVDPA